jgi:uncharacterized protein YqeY
MIMRSLFEYGQLPRLDDATREKHEADIVEKILNDKEKYHSDIEEMIEYFIAEMGNSDFIRLAEKIKEKRIV